MNHLHYFVDIASHRMAPAAAIDAGQDRYYLADPFGRLMPVMYPNRQFDGCGACVAFVAFLLVVTLLGALIRARLLAERHAALDANRGAGSEKADASEHPTPPCEADDGSEADGDGSEADGDGSEADEADGIDEDSDDEAELSEDQKWERKSE